jgi:hypothetical protein
MWEDTVDNDFTYNQPDIADGNGNRITTMHTLKFHGRWEKPECYIWYVETLHWKEWYYLPTVIKAYKVRDLSKIAG